MPILFNRAQLFTLVNSLRSHLCLDPSQPGREMEKKEEDKCIADYWSLGIETYFVDVHVGQSVWVRGGCN